MKMQLGMVSEIRFLSEATRRKSTHALADQVVTSTTNFLTGVIIGRACSKEEFGLYMLGFSVVLFLTVLQTSFISTPYMINSPRLMESARADYSGSTLIHQFAFSALTILALSIGYLVISLGVEPQRFLQVMRALILTITFIMLREYVRRICFADLRMKAALLVDFNVFVVQISGLLLLNYMGLLSASRAYLVLGAACGSAVMKWLISNRKDFSLRVSQAISEFGRNLSLGKWLFAGALVWALTTQLYLWILAAFHGSASAGVWSACLGIVGLGNPVVFGIQNFLGPKIANVYAKESTGVFHQYVLKATTIYTAIVMPFFFTMLIFSGSLVTLVYGDKYAGNGIVIYGLALHFLAMVVGFSFSRALFALGRPDLNFLANCVGLFVLLTIGLWLIRSFGASGAAIGLFLGDLAGLVVLYVHYSRCVSSITIKK